MNYSFLKRMVNVVALCILIFLFVSSLGCINAAAQDPQLSNAMELLKKAQDEQNPVEKAKKWEEYEKSMKAYHASYGILDSVTYELSFDKKKMKYSREEAINLVKQITQKFNAKEIKQAKLLGSELKIPSIEVNANGAGLIIQDGKLQEPLFAPWNEINFQLQILRTRLTNKTTFQSWIWINYKICSYLQMSVSQFDELKHTDFISLAHALTVLGAKSTEKQSSKFSIITYVEWPDEFN